jgi:pyruvate kinase
MGERIKCGTGSEGAMAPDPHELDRLIAELRVLRESMLEAESRLLPRLDELDAAGIASARNLAHFLAMRSFDLRLVQDRLAAIGLSSLGRCEPQVLASLDKVLALLHLLAGRAAEPTAGAAAPPLNVGALKRRAEALFGPAPAHHSTRIMVTLPSAAAVDDALVESLVRGGMDVARINCAHDDAADWVAMADRVRRIAAANARSVKILMDLAGPKLRTGPIAAGPAVLKLKPARDAFGVVTSPVRLGLRAAGTALVVPGATAHVGVDAAWLAALEIADHIDLVDARASARRLTVLAKGDEGVLVEVQRTVYLTDETRLRMHRRGHDVHETALADLSRPEGHLHLRRGEMLRLMRHGAGHDASDGSARKRIAVATVACTLPEALDSLRKGERVWFDDGRIGGVVRRVRAKGLDVEITDAAEDGSKLGADKGINLPDTRLDLPALTPKDIEDLAVVARHADLVGLSFAQGASDVKLLRRHLRRLDAGELGIVLKVETRRGFEHLPQLLFAAMACSAAGVMIARGDLAVECGFERLAEVQEEILWACEAAHMPVVWATQVLESQAKTGLPSRAEITDAAMGERAECVMLNKGPHILEALRTLADILHRMQSLQAKKRPLLRALKAWNGVDTEAGIANAPAVGKADLAKPRAGASRPHEINSPTRLSRE